MSPKIPSDLRNGIRALRRPEGYLAAGYPRFMGLFARDSLISSMELMRYDSSIARGTLLELARLQGRVRSSATNEEPGKIIHEYNDPRYISKEWLWVYRSYRPWIRLGVPTYYSVDSTPLFIIAASEYYAATRDREFLRRIWGNIDRAAAWMAKYGLKGGLLSYRRVSNAHGLASQSWKDGPSNSFDALRGSVSVVEVQGYAYAALRSAAALQDALGTQLSINADNIATEIKEAYNGAFWDKGGEFAVATARGIVIKQAASNIGHLLFTGILDRQQQAAVIGLIFDRGMFTRYGVRTLSLRSNAFEELSYQSGAIWPHDNWMIAQGMRKCGRDAKYDLIRRAIILAYREKGVLPEFYGVTGKGELIPDWRMKVPPCSPQAWSIGAAISFLGLRSPKTPRQGTIS